MSKSRILKTALTEISKGIKKVDLGDLTRKPNVSERIKAIDRMVGNAGKKVADTVDDWGWKGGKPGEITGLNFRRAIRDADSGGSAKTLTSIYNKAQRQVFGKGKGSHSATFKAMNQFADMESANIPRRYTGKIYKTTGEFVTNPNADNWISHPKYIRSLTSQNIAEMLSEQLKPLNNKQRLEAVKLLPEWSRSLDDLGETAKEITKMTNDQRETFLALLPEWTESLDDLAKAAKTL